MPGSLLTEPELLWSREVGAGHASPVSDGRHVYLFTRQEEAERLRALELTTGHVTWERELQTEKPSIGFAGRSHGRGPKATPLLTSPSNLPHDAGAEPASAIGAQIITWGMTGVLSAHAADSGRLRWRRTLVEFPQATPDFGTSASPLQAGDHVVVTAGGEEGGALIALSLDTGETLWQHNLPIAYSSPVLAEIDGQPQLVLLALDEVVAIEPTTGELLWAHPYLGKGYAQDVATPLIVEHPLGTSVLVSGDKRPTLLLQPRRAEDDRWSAHVVWSNDDVATDMSSPVQIGDQLFLQTQQKKGQLTALDLSTGTTQWTSEARWGEHGSLVAFESSAVALRSDATLQLWSSRPDGSWRLDGGVEVANSPTWAHPLVLSDGTLLIKDKTHLRRLRLWTVDSP